MKSDLAPALHWLQSHFDFQLLNLGLTIDSSEISDTVQQVKLYGLPSGWAVESASRIAVTDETPEHWLISTKDFVITYPIDTDGMITSFGLVFDIQFKEDTGRAPEVFRLPAYTASAQNADDLRAEINGKSALIFNLGFVLK